MMQERSGSPQLGFSSGCFLGQRVFLCSVQSEMASVLSCAHATLRDR
jgi:hypothetical protein